MNRKFLLILCFTVFLSGIVFAGATSEAITIGVSGPYTGDLASYGIPSAHAVELLVNKWNERGGVLGKEIKLVIEDDECDPKASPDIAAKLIGEGVIAVIGHICSGATEAALSVYRDSNVIVISPSATNPSLTYSGDYPNFFRAIAPDDAQARVMVDFVKSIGLQNIAVLHDKQSYGKGLAEFVKTFLDQESDINVLLFEGIQANAVDYSAILNKIANSGADAIIFGGYHPEASKLLIQMAEKGMDVPFISGDGIKDESLIRIAGANAEGVYASGANDTTSEPIAIEAKQAHIAAYGEDPGTFFYNAYGAIESLLRAIETAGTTDYDAVTGTLRRQYVDTSLGSISFDARGDAIGVGFTMFQVQNGQYVEIEF